jgi:predicted nucleic acid-binding protein
VGAALEPLILVGDVATCGVIELEVLYSARSHQDLVRTRATRSLAFPLIPMVQSDFDRAADVMEALAQRGQHRAVGLPDLLIAAVAERSGLIVLRYDADFDLVAAVTGQPIQWIVPRGSVP